MMSSDNFRNILDKWHQQLSDAEPTQSLEVTLKQSDLHRLEALAKTFDRPISVITSELLHGAINEIEASMPYVAGEKVIRIEEGQEIFEDIGPTPDYLAALNDLKHA